MNPSESTPAAPAPRHIRCPSEVVNAEITPGAVDLLERAGGGCLLDATYHRRTLDQSGLENAVVISSEPTCAAAGLCRMQQHRQARAAAWERHIVKLGLGGAVPNSEPTE